MTNLTDVCGRVKYCFEKSDLTYVEFEKKTGIPKSSLQRYVNGITKKIPIEALEKMSVLFGVSLVWLLYGQELLPEDDEFIAALGEIKPLGELPPEAEAINIFAESFGERIIKVDDNLFFGECGMLSEDELNYIKSSASDAIKFAYEQIKKKRLSSLF